MPRVQVDQRWLEAHDHLLNRAQDTSRLLLQGLYDLQTALNTWEAQGLLEYEQALEDAIAAAMKHTRTLHDLLVAIGKPW